MAMKPAKAAPPAAADDDDEDQMAGAGQDGAGDGDDGADADDGGEDSGPTVIATILDNHDGTYTLVHGDEPEAGADGDERAEDADAEDADAGAEGDAAGTPGAAAPAAGAGDEDEGPAQEHFDAPGPLLKAVLDILNSTEEQNGAGEHAFAAGFNEDQSPTPKK